MLVPECNEICGIEIVRRPFALDGCWSLSVGSDHKVHLVPALVSPIEHFAGLRTSHNFIQHEMLPQCPKVIIPQVRPATVVTNETGIEAIDFGRGDNLGGPTSAEWPNYMRDERCLKNAEVVCDGRPAYFAGAGKSSCLKDAAALCHDELGESLERISPLKTEEFLDILSPISVDPFLKVAFRMFLRQKEGRKSAPQKAVLEVRLVCVVHVEKAHRRQPEVPLPSRQRVSEFLRGAQSRRTGCHNV